MTAFDDVMAGINGGLKRQWYKCNETSGFLSSAGDGNTQLITFNGSGSLTYDVTGSEDTGTSGKAIQSDGQRSVKATTCAMGGTTGSHSLWMAVKSLNAAVNQSAATGYWHAISNDNNSQHWRIGANRASDSNGFIIVTMQTSAGNSLQVLVDPADFGAGAWDDDTWHYYAVVQPLDGGGMDVYIDGVEVTTGVSTTGTADNDDTMSDIGIDNFDNLALFSQGDASFSNKSEIVIDNCILWQNFALTAQNVLDLFQASVPPVITSTTRRTGRRVFNDALAS